MFEFDPVEERIIRVLASHNYFLTTTNVAEKAGISWNTAEKCLEQLHKKYAWIQKMQRGNRKYWRVYR